MVTQRTGENVRDAAFTGACKGTGTLRARVLNKGAVLPGFDGIVVGSASRGKLEGRLSGVPVGGPYQVEFAIEGTTERLMLKEIYVGDLWILGGQSNMQGCGLRKSALPPIPQVRAFFMDDRWAPAKDPLHNLWNAVDEAHRLIHWGIPVEVPSRGVGPGVAFGQAMYELTGVPQGLLACAHGGTTMSEWNPKLKQQGSKSLYGATVRRLKKNGGKVAGVVWYQGCSDANVDAAPLYTKRMKELVAAFRRDCGDADLPFVAVQIANVYGPGFDRASWNSVQDQERRLPDVIKRCNVVPAIDASYDDTIHLDGPSQHRLGKRLARAMLALITNDPVTRQPISMKKVTYRSNRMLGSMDITIEFDHVVGGLQATGRPMGFTLNSKAGETLFYKTEIDGNKVILHSNVMAWDIEHKELWYGYGTMPYCNITDGADRALPVFGPINIGNLRALSSFVRAFRISPALPLTGAVEDLPLPSASELHSHVFPAADNNFCNVYSKWLDSTEPQVIWYACRFNCPEAMDLSLSLGYDGPVAVWVNGKRIFADPQGNNPAVPDEKQVRYIASQGEHEVLVALSSNNHHAWGIFLRFERHDVPKKQIKEGSYAMPQILEIAEEELVNA